MTGEAADLSIRHLRAVPDEPRQADAQLTPGAAGLTTQSGFGGPDRAAMAAVLRREADLLTAVRGPAASSSAAVRVERERAPGPVDPVVPSAPAPPAAPLPVAHGAEPIPGPAVESLEIARRFEALATEKTGEPGEQDPLGIGAALDRLRFTGPASHAMLPAAALRRLGETDPHAAGSVLIGLLPSLHRVAPDLRLDLDLRGRVLAVTSDGGRTVIEQRRSRRKRRDRDLAVRGRPDLLARAALGYGSRGARGRRGIAVLRALIDFPHSIDGLLADGAALPPAATWSLASAAIAAVPEGPAFTVVQLDADDGAGAVTVTAVAGRPLAVVRGTCGSADATVRTTPGSALAWLAGGDEPVSIEGDPEAAERLRTLFARSCSPIRSRS